METELINQPKYIQGYWRGKTEPEPKKKTGNEEALMALIMTASVVVLLAFVYIQITAIVGSAVGVGMLTRNFVKAKAVKEQTPYLTVNESGKIKKIYLEGKDELNIRLAS